MGDFYSKVEGMAYKAEGVMEKMDDIVSLEGMDRKDFIRLAGALLVGFGAGVNTDIFIGEPNREKNSRDFDRHIGAEKGLPVEQAKEMDVIIDETLLDKDKIEETIRGVVSEMKDAGATDKQIDKSIARYIEYANARLAFIMNESFEQLKTVRTEVKN